MNKKGFRIICGLLLIGGILGTISNTVKLLGGSPDSVRNILAEADCLLQILLALMGLKALKDCSRAPLCIKLALTNIALASVQSIVTCTSGTVMGPVIFLITLLLSMLVPVLYLMGVWKLAA